MDIKNNVELKRPLNFSREQENWISSALNYGYTILRGCIIRSVVGAGLIASLKMHLYNELNSYNLADDLIEPFRPIINLWTYKNRIGKDSLSCEDKRKLINSKATISELMANFIVLKMQLIR